MHPGSPSSTRTQPPPKPPKPPPKRPRAGPNFIQNPQLFQPDNVPDGTQRPCNQTLDDIFNALRTKANITIVGEGDHEVFANNPEYRTTTFAVLEDFLELSLYVFRVVVGGARMTTATNSAKVVAPPHTLVSTPHPHTPTAPVPKIQVPPLQAHLPVILGAFLGLQGRLQGATAWHSCCRRVRCRHSWDGTQGWT